MRSDSASSAVETVQQWLSRTSKSNRKDRSKLRCRGGPVAESASRRLSVHTSASCVGAYLAAVRHNPYCAHSMTHDNTGPVISKFQSMSCSRIRNPRQPVFTLDHDVQNHSDTNMRKYRKIEEFAKQHGIDFYPAGRGIGHQIMVEEGYALPGRLVVASDSHSNHYGGVGCLGTAIVRTDAA